MIKITLNSPDKLLIMSTTGFIISEIVFQVVYSEHCSE